MPGEATSVILSRPTVLAATPRIVPEHDAGILVAGTDGMQALHHARRSASSSRSHVEAHHRGRHQAEVRQRRVAAADARPPEKTWRKPSRSRHCSQLRAGIGDGDEAAGRLLGAQRRCCTRSKK